jgi:hypothetical protein
MGVKRSTNRGERHMEIYARQGDLVISRFDGDVGEQLPAKDHVFAGDSSGHPHVLKGKSKIRVDGRRTLVSVEKPTKLVHGKSDGHPTVEIEAGAYEVYPLRERGDKGDRAVED